MWKQIQSVFDDSRVHPHLFSAAVFQSVAVCIYGETDCAVFVHVIFWRASPGIASILCNEQEFVRPAQRAVMRQANLRCVGRTTHCVEPAFACNRLDYSQHFAAFLFVDFSSALHVSIETVDGGFAYWAIFWISIDKQHPRTACNLVLHICYASDCHVLVIAAVDKYYMKSI